jgi:hypothetical protein
VIAVDVSPKRLADGRSVAGRGEAQLERSLRLGDDRRAYRHGHIDAIATVVGLPEGDSTVSGSASRKRLMIAPKGRSLDGVSPTSMTCAR